MRNQHQNSQIAALNSRTETKERASTGTEGEPMPAPATTPNPELRHMSKPETAGLNASDFKAACEHLADALVEVIEKDDAEPGDSTHTITAHTAAIRALNDAFRQTFRGGRLMLTSGIVDLGATAQRAILGKIATFTAFDDANDPYTEHDFGAIDHDGDKIFWKIDYYDLTLAYGSDDPADPTKTTRVLTVMLAQEY